MSVYPGTEGPELIPTCAIVTDGFAEKIVRLYSHTGTHRDAPSHLIEGGPDLDSYPVLSPGSARWLTGFNLKAIGMDNISADRLDTETFPIHQILLQADILLNENLAHLDRLPVSGFRLTCLPLKLVQAGGTPVRLVAEF
jgi:kynurenine formamidase